MKILLNFFPVSSGGGQQVASNFLKIVSTNDAGHKWFAYVGENSELHNLACQYLPSNNILSTPYSYLYRILNKNLIDRFIREKSIDIIYSFAPILNINSNIPQVVRSVYSNLYFPEINFWKDYPFHTRIKKKIIDSLRLKGTLRANGLIFENKSMQMRASKLFHYPLEKTLYVAPSVTLFDETRTLEKYNELNKLNCFKVLYLSSWHLNKNIHILPEVAKIFKKNNISVKFFLSISRDTKDTEKYLLSSIEKFNVREYFTFLDKIPAEYVHQVVKNSDAMILLSKLECFSSNIIEAFHFKKPLIISDEYWSRGECEDSVLYVDRDDPISISNAIIKLFDKNTYRKYQTKGEQMLKKFNSPLEKIQKQIAFLELIHKNFYK